MSSKGVLNKRPFIVESRQGDYCYYKDPANIRVNIKTCAIERLAFRGKNKGHWYPVPMCPSCKSGCLRFQSGSGCTISAARIVLDALGIMPVDDEHSVVCYKDNNRSNLTAGNLYYGTLSESKGKTYNTWDPEWYENMKRTIPNPKDRNVRNPVYMKLLNNKKDANGETHITRYYRRLKEKMKAL